MIFELGLGVVGAFILYFLVLRGFKVVGDDEVGIVTRIMLGKPLPQGTIIATKKEVGVQADILMPGLHWRMPFISSIKKAPVTVIAPGEIGVVDSIDGAPIPTGRILGDPVDCNMFQDAQMFLDNGGKKGPQVEILRPGTYRINLEVFTVRVSSVIKVPKEKIGVAIAKDGIPLPSNYSIAPEPTAECQHFQNGAAFIKNTGYRGPQLETLQPGEYYLNPLLFEVTIYDVASVPAGYVAVIVSAVGSEFEKARPSESDIEEPPGYDMPVHEDNETVLITNKKERGILRDPVGTGKYNLNPVAYLATLVPTSAITIDWADAERSDSKSARDAEFFTYNQMRFTSKDGFNLAVDIKLIIRILPSLAPWVISRFGSIKNLIEQVAHPLIDSLFRNEAGSKDALQFVHSREEIQASALQKVKAEFAKYHIEVQGLLIAYIDAPKELLDTQTKKQVAEQQQQQYTAEANAQEYRIAVAEKTARADKQSDVIAAKLSIEIAADRADATRREAEGQRDATKAKADGLAYQITETGKAEAGALEAQALAIGKDKLAAIRIMEKIADGKVVVTPQTLISGGDDQGGNLMSALFGLIVAEKAEAANVPAVGQSRR